MLDSATVDQDAVVLWPEGATRPPVNGVNDQQDHDFGVTLEMTSTGWQVLDKVDLTGTIAVPGAGEYALRLWDEDQGGVRVGLYTTITPGIMNSRRARRVHRRQFARREIENVLRGNGSNVFQCQFHANRSSNYAQWDGGSQRHNDRPIGDDNIEVEVVIILPP